MSCVVSELQICQALDSAKSCSSTMRGGSFALIAKLMPKRNSKPSVTPGEWN